MVLGLLLIGGSITLFSGNVHSARLNHAIAGLHANARFALDELAADVRAAGFQGCVGAEDSILRLMTSKAPAGTLRAESIRAAEVRSTGWVPAGPPGYSAPTGVGAPVTGTQALMLQYAKAPGHRLTDSMTSRNANVNVALAQDDLFAGELAIIADCKSVDVFELASVDNSTAGLSLGTNTALSQTYVVNSEYPDNTRVYPLISRIYYVGSTGRTNDNGDPVRSLYRQELPYDGNANPPLELVEGVDQLQLSFGADQDGAMHYREASSVGTSTEVELVRIGLLLSSHQRFTETGIGRIHTLVGRSVRPATSDSVVGPTYPADARLRLPFSMTIKVRNRGLGSS